MIAGKRQGDFSKSIFVKVKKVILLFLYNNEVKEL